MGKEFEIRKGKASRVGPTRRDFLAKSAATGAYAAALAAGMGAISSGYRNTAHAAAMADPSILDGLSADYIEKNQLVFMMWPYMPEIPKGYVAEFMAQYGENARVEPIPGDYGSAMVAKFIAKDKVDICYSGAGLFTLEWGQKGWIKPVEDYWRIDEVKEELYPISLAASKLGSPNGDQVMGLPYYQTVYPGLMGNKLLMDELGVTPADYPKTFPELYAHLREVAKEGGKFKTPYLPFWHAGGYGPNYAFMGETVHRNAELVDENLEPNLGPDHPALEVIEDWRALVADGIADTGILSGTDEGQQTDYFSKGAYVYTLNCFYDLINNNNPERSQIAGHAIGLPSTPTNSWGVHWAAFYVLPETKPRDEIERARALRFLGFMGHKDKNSKFFTPTQWIEKQALHTGYKGVMWEPQNVKSYEAWIPEGMLEEQMKLFEEYIYNAKIPRIFHVPWASKFAFAELNERLQAAILGTKTPKAVMIELAEVAEKLHEREVVRKRK